MLPAIRRATPAPKTYLSNPHQFQPTPIEKVRVPPDPHHYHLSPTYLVTRYSLLHSTPDSRLAPTPPQRIPDQRLIRRLQPHLDIVPRRQHRHPPGPLAPDPASRL